MTDEELQKLCDSRVRQVLDVNIDLPEPIRLIILTGALAAAAHAAGFGRESVIGAVNTVFDDIEKGEIPGEIT